VGPLQRRLKDKKSNVRKAAKKALQQIKERSQAEQS